MVFVKAEQSASTWVFYLALLLASLDTKNKNKISIVKEVLLKTQLKLEVGKGKYYQSLITLYTGHSLLLKNDQNVCQETLGRQVKLKL